MAGKSKARCVHLPLSQLTNANEKIARSSSASSLPRKPASSTPRSVLGWVPSSRRSSMIREVRVCHRPVSRRPALFFVGLPSFPLLPPFFPLLRACHSREESHLCNADLCHISYMCSIPLFIFSPSFHSETEGPIRRGQKDKKVEFFWAYGCCGSGFVAECCDLLIYNKPWTCPGD